MILQQKIKAYIRTATAHASRLRDIRVAGQVLFVIIVLLVSWSGVKAIDTNYTLEKQIAALQQQNSVQALQNTNLGLQNDYLNTTQYLELSARQNFGLAAPGEKELIVPEAVALAYTTPVPKTAQPQAAAASLPWYQRNAQAWLDFFLHRPPVAN